MKASSDIPQLSKSHEQHVKEARTSKMGTDDGGQAWGDKRQETETCCRLLPLLDWSQEVKGDESSREDKTSVESSKRKDV